MYMTALLVVFLCVCDTVRLCADVCFVCAGEPVCLKVRHVKMCSERFFYCSIFFCEFVLGCIPFPKKMVFFCFFCRDGDQIIVSTIVFYAIQTYSIFFVAYDRKEKKINLYMRREEKKTHTTILSTHCTHLRHS